MDSLINSSLYMENIAKNERGSSTSWPAMITIALLLGTSHYDRFSSTVRNSLLAEERQFHLKAIFTCGVHANRSGEVRNIVNEQL